MDKAIIIDDDLIFSKALAHKLENTYGFEVQSFKNAEKSLSQRIQNPDIIFIDYQLGIGTEVMDGLMALGVLKKNYPNCTMVMMSGEENTHWLEQGRKYGANASLTKSKDQLVDLEKVVTDFRVKRGKK